MSLEQLVKQAEAMENDQQAETEKLAGDYQSADDIKNACHERAVWIVSGIHSVMQMMRPEATPIVFDDKTCSEGVSKIEAVLVKYPGGELPAWMKKLLSYQEEFKAGAWFAGVVWQVNQIDKQIQEQKQQQQQQEGEDDGQQSE